MNIMYLVRYKAPAGENAGLILRDQAYDAALLGRTDEESVPESEYDQDGRIWTCYATWTEESDARAFVAQHP